MKLLIFLSIDRQILNITIGFPENIPSSWTTFMTIYLEHLAHNSSYKFDLFIVFFNIQIILNIWKCNAKIVKKVVLFPGIVTQTEINFHTFFSTVLFIKRYLKCLGFLVENVSVVTLIYFFGSLLFGIFLRCALYLKMSVIFSITFFL